MLEHLIKSPRAHMLWDQKTLSSPNISTMKSAFIDAFEANANSNLKENVKKVAAAAKAQDEFRAAGRYEEARAEGAKMRALKPEIDRLKKKTKSLRSHIDKEFKREIRAIKARWRDNQRLMKRMEKAGSGAGRRLIRLHQGARDDRYNQRDQREGRK